LRVTSRGLGDVYKRQIHNMSLQTLVTGWLIKA
jgi:hypothetical protein